MGSRARGKDKGRKGKAKRKTTTERNRKAKAAASATFSRVLAHPENIVDKSFSYWHAFPSSTIFFRFRLPNPFNSCCHRRQFPKGGIQMSSPSSPLSCFVVSSVTRLLGNAVQPFSFGCRVRLLPRDSRLAMSFSLKVGSRRRKYCDGYVEDFVWGN